MGSSSLRPLIRQELGWSCRRWIDRRVLLTFGGGAYSTITHSRGSATWATPAWGSGPKLSLNTKNCLACIFCRMHLAWLGPCPPLRSPSSKPHAQHVIPAAGDGWLDSGVNSNAISVRDIPDTPCRTIPKAKRRLQKLEGMESGDVSRLGDIVTWEDAGGQCCGS